LPCPIPAASSILNERQVRGRDRTLFRTGGPAWNQGLREALEDELMLEVKVLPEPQFTVAYGAALTLFKS